MQTDYYSIHKRSLTNAFIIRYVLLIFTIAEFYPRNVELQEHEKKKIHIAELRAELCPCYYEQQKLMYFFPLFMDILCPSFAWSTHVSLYSMKCVYTNLEMYNFFLIKFVSAGANFLQYLPFLYICVIIFLFLKRF